MLGMEVPLRAVWGRTLLAELNRVLNHLMFLGSYPIELGAITPMFYAFREREELQELMEEISGGRMHYMFNRVGGLKEDIPAGWPDRARRVIKLVKRRVRDDIDTLVRGNEIFRARTRGVGVKAPEGATYAWTENPLGINGYFLVSRGERTPWRMKLRTASFNNVQVLSELLPGCLIGDMVSILGSMFFVVGDIDK